MVAEGRGPSPSPTRHAASGGVTGGCRRHRGPTDVAPSEPPLRTPPTSPDGAHHAPESPDHSPGHTGATPTRTPPGSPQTAQTIRAVHASLEWTRPRAAGGPPSGRPAWSGVAAHFVPLLGDAAV
ncbi:ESX-1 secretion-associated protein EspI-like [Dermacentor silvarum]|uniref:ESX-1 secretion-associated protein EspI-like n=1 Tax=Dermacentor silvarum TaxID=543639 RepID=UPI002100A16B|nr:ESX-1 secretion-associated protein EspI-like [Dermacentor silvarum]